MLKGYTLECSPESRAFRGMSAATGDGTMVINVFSSADSETRHFAAYPTDSNFHDRLDDGGGSDVPGCRMDCPQPCPTCLRRRQCSRTPLRHSGVVAVSGYCATARESRENRRRA